MRAHQAASSASSSREKCTRPLVVEAVIVPLLGSWSGSAWPPGREWVVNDLKPALRVFEMSANWPHLFRLISNRFRFELRSPASRVGIKMLRLHNQDFWPGPGCVL